MTRTCRTESHDKKVVGPSCRASGSLVRPGGSMPGELHRHHGCISRVNYFHPMPHPIHDKELTGSTVDAEKLGKEEAAGGGN